MSRSTRSTTRILGAKSPSRNERKNPAPAKDIRDPLGDAIATINTLMESFVHSATEVQMLISSEIEVICKQDNHFMSAIVNDKNALEQLCTRVSQINNTLKTRKILENAVQQWHQLMKNNPITSILKLGSKIRREICCAGRGIAASLFITGNIYSGLTILKEVVEVSDHDPHSAVILLRWLVRLCEWEAMEKYLEYDRQREKSSLEGFDEFVSICRDILDFHRSPKGREQKAIDLMKRCDQLNEANDKTFQVYESQMLVYSALALVSKVAGIGSRNMMDPLYCIDNAYQRADAVVKSRWASFSFDKPLDGLKTKSDNTVDYLKTASAVAEYFELLRIMVNEYVRITETMTLLLFTRLRSEAEKDEVISVKKLIHSTFISQDEVNKTTKEGEGGSCLTPIISKLSCASLSPLHIPSPSSTCSCYLCLEYRYNPSFAFLSSKVSFLYSGYSKEAVKSLVSRYNDIRSDFAPLQQKLMYMSADKPRAPSWMCDEMGKLIISFLLSPIGLSMGRKDSQRTDLLNIANRICSYSSQLCLPYRLILKHLTRKPKDALSFPWMSSKSIITSFGDLSIGSEGQRNTTPSRSPFLRKLNTPIRPKRKSVGDESMEKEEEEERNEFTNYSHLLYHDWRSRICEQLALKSNDSWKKAMYLSESVAVSTRQARRLIDGNIKPFGFKSVDEFKGAVSKMPQDMTVNELVVTMSGDLYLIKVNSMYTPIVIPLARENKWTTIMEGFTRAMTKSDETAQAGKELTDAKKYWEGRRKAEEMMRKAMVDMESDLLGAFAPLLLPSRKLTKDGESVVTSLIRCGEGSMKKDIAREMVSIAAQISYTKFKPLVECMGVLEKWSTLQMNALLEMKKNKNDQGCGKLILQTKNLPFVFFVLSTELSRSPWEAVSIIHEKAHSSRLISIHQLFSLLNSSNNVPYSANPLSAFYILDPADNLAATKNRLTPIVEKVSSWKGVTGRAPDKYQVGSIITENDFFIFLGHGDGFKHLSRSVIRKSRCRSVVLLMGCSSVHTVHEGRGMDGKGAVIDYSVASCPCLVGCIYTVTDGEIDKYFTAFVNDGLARHLNHKDDLTPSSELRLHLEAMAKARTKVKLPYLTGSTVVSYGIPIDIRVKNTP
ncbi:sep-1 [Pristionchus pacificus]|uniref:separase n=1 Tax=Pristionchus pacificus TaxID=54126 RepID=A0A2A6BYR9_PRIPA|nr:sep-1 [Pristionchus pacificus]|eukprot:PDM70913.1 sep-1 [Pristionchus pacificus]